jgi:hypothetical protein
VLLEALSPDPFRGVQGARPGRPKEALKAAAEVPTSCAGKRQAIALADVYSSEVSGADSVFDTVEPDLIDMPEGMAAG